MPDDKREFEDFWDLGEPRKRKYAKPDFSGHTIEATDIIVEAFADLQDALSDLMETGEEQSKEEKIELRKETTEAEGKSVSPSFWRDPIGGGRVVKTSYRRHVTKRSSSGSARPSEKSLGATVAEYVDRGMLIKKVEVRTWQADTEFYGRFTSDAAVSHRSKPSRGIDEALEPVPYFSYVPQYAHMNRSQIEYYLYVRENIRAGRRPKCDPSYIRLYVFEIINLPNEIPPEIGAHLLARIWLGYRDEYPRLDGYLCEWMPDYCMIYGIPLPDELTPILPELTAKAQFKEFFIDAAAKADTSLGGIMAEAISDYDYKTSRYYAESKELFDTHIPASLNLAVRAALDGGKSVFCLDRAYKMVRDSYCGAIVSSAVKRRIDIEFYSFTRRADARKIATDMVKYAENKVRTIAGVKAKLNSDKLDTDLAALIDQYFLPLIPERSRSAEDRYMPDDYLKNYEADDSGFDFLRAENIERLSWVNTERLTGETIAANESSLYEAPPEPIDGEISFNVNDGQPELLGDDIGFDADDGQREPITADEASDADERVRSALRAALEGRFGEYCRSIGVPDGEIADRVNTRMLDVLGDVALEPTSDGYELIEDYREDIKDWL